MGLSKLEQLEAAYEEYVTILEFRGLKESTGLYGTYHAKDGRPYIVLELDQPEIDKCVILTEEFMHMLTSNGVILNQAQLSNRRQELLARRLTYKSAISVEDLIRCYNLGLQLNYEIANELDLPAEFVKNAIEYFKTQLHNGESYDGYMINIGTTIDFIKDDGNSLAL